MKQIIFHSSLPRSGGSALQDILAQNLDFHTESSSGLVNLLIPTKDSYQLPEFKARSLKLAEPRLQGLCKGALEGYYNSITDKKYIVDRNSQWSIHRSFLNSFYPEPKIVCMVRDLRDIFASKEKQFRQNQYKYESGRKVQEMQGTTLPKRVDMWIANSNFGIALESLNEVIRQNYDDKILFIKYEDFCLRPESEMIRLYQHLDIPAFEHNFDEIVKVTKNDYEVYDGHDQEDMGSVYGLKRKPSDYKIVLGADVSDWIYDNYKWFFTKFNYKK